MMKKACEDCVNGRVPIQVQRVSPVDGSVRIDLHYVVCQECCVHKSVRNRDCLDCGKKLTK